MVIDGQELVGGQMRVFLCRAERGVSQQFLNRTQVRAFVEQVGRIGMTERMGADRAACQATGVAGDETGDTARGQTASTVVEKQGRRKSTLRGRRLQ